MKIKRIEAQDCTIADISRSNTFTIVTVNVNDFVNIDLANVEDWIKLK